MQFEIPSPLADSWRLLTRTCNEGLFGIGCGPAFYAALALLAALLLRGLFAHLVLRMFRAVAGKDAGAANMIVRALAEPLKLVFLIVGLDIALRILTLPEEAQTMADRVVRSLIAIAVFWALHRLAAALRAPDAPLSRALAVSTLDWLVKALQILFMIVGAAAVLEIWGVRVAPLLAGLGIFGVAVALGAQDLFKNIIGGLAVLAEKRFRNGDWILVDGVVEGTVESINFRSTVVRRFDKSPVYVPNSVFSDSAVVNFSRMTERRIHWTIGLEYGVTIEQLRAVCERIKRYLRDGDNFARPPQAPLFVHVEKFSDSSVDIMVYCFTRTTNWGEWLAVKEALALEIKRIVESEGAAFAFPSRTVYHVNVDRDGPEPFRPDPALQHKSVGGAD